MSKEIIWKPSKDLVENSKLTKFLNFSKIQNYNELEKKSLTDPGWLWDSVIKFSDLKFFKPYSKIIMLGFGVSYLKKSIIPIYIIPINPRGCMSLGTCATCMANKCMLTN